MAAPFIHSRTHHLSRALDIFLRALLSSLGSIVHFIVFYRDFRYQMTFRSVRNY